MQKKNKILMMAVSSLLCLTLISSCLVSSVFAKYVTKDTATATAVIEKFGVTLSVSSLSATEQANYGVTVTDNSTDNLKNAGVYSITVSGLKMGPGDKIEDLLAFTIGGTPNVDCQLKIDTTITYSTAVIADNATEAVKKAGTFRVPKEELDVGSDYYFPIQVLCDAYNGNTLQRNDINCLSSWRNVGSPAASQTVDRILAQNLDLTCNDAKLTKGDDETDDEFASKYLYPQGSTGHVYKDFKANKPASLYLRTLTGDEDTNKYDNNLVGYDKPILAKEDLAKLTDDEWNKLSANLTAVNTLKFGLNYVYEYGSSASKPKYDAISTYFAQQENPPTFSVTFVFTITQTSQNN